jgi:putative transposase
MAKKSISPELKLKIVIEAIKEERHMSEIASEYGVHTATISRWIQELFSSADKVYASSKADKQAAKEQEEQVENLYAQIGRLTTQLDWLKKNLKESSSREEREAMVEWDLNHHRDLNIRAQAEFMDGKGRALDNAITERFWRTLKREDIYLK